jgi:virginiamycin B lyase
MATTSYQISTGTPFPYGMCVGPDLRLWFCETLATANTGKIGAIDVFTGTITEYSLGDNHEPMMICSGPDGNLWFTEGLGNHITAMDTSGNIIHQYDVPTGSSGPRGICVGPDGNIWFTEFNAGKIGKVTTGGSFTEYDCPDVDDTWTPFGICVGADNRLWFTGGYINYIGAMTTGGVGTAYAVTPAYVNLACICSGADDALYFAEFGASTMGRITTDGTYSEYYSFMAALPFNPVFMANGPDGTVWMSEEFAVAGDYFQYVTTSGPSKAITRFDPSDGHYGMTGFVLGPDGNIWYCDGFTELGTVTSYITKYPLDYTKYASPAECPVRANGYGYLARNSAQDTWANVKAATFNVYDTANGDSIQLSSYTVSDQYTVLARTLLVFDTSYIPLNATITGATLKFKVSAKDKATNTTNAEAGIAVTGVDMKTTQDRVPADWLNLETTRYATDIEYDDVSTSVITEMELNEDGIAAIGKGWGGHTLIALSYACDVDDTPPATWTYFDSSSYTITYTGEDAPVLEVTYTVGSYKLTATAVGSDAPVSWELVGSDNGSDWTLLDEQTNILFNDDEEKTFYISDSHHYKNTRLYGTTLNGGAWELDTLEFVYG